MIEMKYNFCQLGTFTLRKSLTLNKNRLLQPAPVNGTNPEPPSQGSPRPRRLDGLDQRRKVFKARPRQDESQQLRVEDGQDVADSRL